MRSLSDTVARLAAARRMASVPTARGAHGGMSLTPIAEFGSNPGKLKGWVYVPPGLRAGAPLVVVLHGCTQTAASYDLGSGWSTLAARHGFVLLYPEQQRANNANLCFNWFVPEDIRRDGGEAFSIRQMISRVVADHAIDPHRVFVTGLSAGGAMTAAMLATYPEVFAGGAVIAGLPFATATSMPEAFDRMRGQGLPTTDRLAAKVRGASDHDGPWPMLSVWHGSADMTVSPANMDAIVDQWRTLQDLPVAPARTESIGGHLRRIWAGQHGRPRIEAITVQGMGHGTPIDPALCGSAMPYMLDAGISSTDRIAAFWGIEDASAAIATRPLSGTADAVSQTVLAAPVPPAALAGVAKVIDDALRAAGLVR